MRCVDNVIVVSITRLTESDQLMIADVDPRVDFLDAGGWFDNEIIDAWPAWTSHRYVGTPEAAAPSRAERDAVLAKAEVVLGSWPYPKDLRARSPKLKWFHQRPAGASNLWLGDLWKSDVMVTTSRGHGNTTPIAEYAIAGILHFAKGLHDAIASQETEDPGANRVRAMLLSGKQVCVVGVGGIGREVGRLAAALGMRVVGVRREAMDQPPKGFSEIAGADQLLRLLTEADFVVVCAQLTRETENLMNAAAFAAIKPGGVLVNIARGEIVDEDAMLSALDSGQLFAAVLDVYIGEFDGPPGLHLWKHPRILLTPHSSGHTDGYQNQAIDVFRDNLRAYLAGEPLKYVIDWERGY